MKRLRKAFADAGGKAEELMSAISYRPGDVRELLKDGADITYRNKSGCTPLIWAAYKKKAEVVKLLVEQGAELDLKNIRGTTALMFAAKWGHAETVSLLVKSGADIDAADNDGCTALDYARRYRKRDAVEIFEAVLQARADKLTAEHAQECHATARWKQSRLKSLAQRVERSMP